MFEIVNNTLKDFHLSPLPLLQPINYIKLTTEYFCMSIFKAYDVRGIYPKEINENDNLDNISNVTLTLTDEQTTEKINYDTRLLQLFAQKINNNLYSAFQDILFSIS